MIKPKTTLIQETVSVLWVHLLLFFFFFHSILKMQASYYLLLGNDFILLDQTLYCIRLHLFH